MAKTDIEEAQDFINFTNALVEKAKNRIISGERLKEILSQRNFEDVEVREIKSQLKNDLENVLKQLTPVQIGAFKVCW